MRKELNLEELEKINEFLVTVREASDIIRYSQSSIRNMLSQEVFTCYKVGNKTLIDKRELVIGFKRPRVD